MPKVKKNKPKYEAPVLLPLGELAHGQEQCQPGTGPTSGSCKVGTNGFATCNPGNTAETTCVDGTTPDGNCSPGSGVGGTS